MKYYDNLKEIRSLKTLKIRNHLRSLALDGLSVIDRINGIQNALNRNRIQFLYIHHVFKDEETKFKILLKQLSQNHTFITYSEAVNKILNGTIDKPYIAISSDDGIRNNLRAAEIMDDNGAKACFFINPKITGNPDYETIKTFCKVRLRFPPVEFLNWRDVDRLLSMGHEIGSHTMEHLNIADSSAEEFREDCIRSFEIIKQRCGDVKHFSWPYGRFFHFNETGRKSVFASGFVSCASAERGCHINSDRKISYDEICIRRDHIIINWNINHIYFFIARNSRRASPGNNYFPYNNTI